MDENKVGSSLKDKREYDKKLLKDQYKLLKDIGKGVTDGVKKLAEPFVKEAVGLPEAKKLLQGLKASSKKIIKRKK